MKRLLSSIALIVLTCVALRAQDLSGFDRPYVEDFGAPNEVWLGSPNFSEGTQIVPVGIDLWEGNDNNTIHYGAVPPGGNNAPVVVFVHGYAANAYVWFEGDDNMYADVYRDGYRSAFVSLTPNRHIWTNGNMLSNAIDRIRSNYGVNKVILVGWSKGGVDCDAALNHFGANTKVSQAFTLSTPHNGTSIAELANSVLLSLVNIIFMQDNDGTRSLQRGYMDYYRSITDSKSTNTVPFTTLGGWGNGPLNRLDIPQAILHGIDGPRTDGGNDGVVPYRSSRRPGGTELFSGQRKEYYWWGGWHYPGPSQTNLDHFEVTRGGLVWPYFESRISNNNRLDIPTAVTPTDYLPNQVVSSQMQIVTALEGKRQILVAPNSKKVSLFIGQKGEQPISIYDNSGQRLSLTPTKSERLTKGGHKTEYVLENPKAGAYTIESNDAFVAIASFEGGATATLTRTDAKRVYDTNDNINLELDFTTESGQAIEGSVVSGVAVRTMDLAMNVIDEDPVAISFIKNKEGRFVAQWKGVKKPGIYNLSVTAQGGQAQRTVTTSLAVVGQIKEELEQTGELSINAVYPNPSRGPLNIQLNATSASKLTVYNVYGQVVRVFDLSDASGVQQVTWDASSLEKGLYIIQLTDGDQRISKKVILK